MSPRGLLLLVVLGVAALGGGYWFGTATQPRQEIAVDTGKLMFPDLASRLKNATRIEIASQGKTATIALKDGTWGLADRGGYRVTDSKLRGMLTALTELRLVEPRTTDPAQFARLGVEDPGTPDAKSTLLKVLDAQGKPILEVIVGHRRVRTQAKVPETVYVRRPGDNQAWLAEGNLQADADPQLWLDRDIMNIDHKRVGAVTVKRGETTLEFSAKDGKMALAAPADHPALDDYRLDDVGRALEYLNFQDVQTDADKVGEEIGTAVISTVDGLQVAARVFRGEKDIWVRFAVKGEDKAKEEADRLAARVAGWTYQLGNWKEKALVPSLDDLKKAAETPAPAAEAPMDKPADQAGDNAPPTADDKPATEGAGEKPAAKP